MISPRFELKSPAPKSKVMSYSKKAFFNSSSPKNSSKRKFELFWLFQYFSSKLSGFSGFKSILKANAVRKLLAKDISLAFSPFFVPRTKLLNSCG